MHNKINRLLKLRWQMKDYLQQKLWDVITFRCPYLSISDKLCQWKSSPGEQICLHKSMINGSPEVYLDVIVPKPSTQANWLLTILTKISIEGIIKGHPSYFSRF